MYYSSGTTGRPKGIKRPLSGELIGEAVPAGTHLNQLFGLSDGSILLSPAPLYHAMPLEFSMGIQASGGTLVIMEKFDPNEALCCIETYRCTDGLWVPTMFTRMLKLPDEERTRYDLSSLKGAIHAAAPCPISVKEQMIQWWGPILLEYYAASEFNGFTFIDSAQWLTHKGSVGKPLMGIIHICDDAGQELPEGKIGSIYFELPEMNFEYHNDAEQTKSAQHPRHPNWTNVGDIS
jgi:fatty-acyl-CoA synthase